MALLDRLNEDMKKAMREKDKEKLAVIRLLKSSLQNEEIKHQGTLTPDEEMTVLSREMKQRRDALLEFEKAGRNDLVEKIRSEIAVLELYAPKQLTEDELKQIVEDTIREVGATSKADFGKVMTVIMPKIKGQANGSDVNRFVKQYLL